MTGTPPVGERYGRHRRAGAGSHLSLDRALYVGSDHRRHHELADRLQRDQPVEPIRAHGLRRGDASDRAAVGTDPPLLAGPGRRRYFAGDPHSAAVFRQGRYWASGTPLRLTARPCSASPTPGLRCASR